MKVTIAANVPTAERLFVRGELVDLDDKLAKAWIAAGLCVEGDVSLSEKKKAGLSTKSVK